MRPPPQWSRDRDRARRVAQRLHARRPGLDSQSQPDHPAPAKQHHARACGQPTAIGSPVATLEEAARLVIASDPRFATVTRLDPNVIGASAWWEGRALQDGFQIMVTIGWGDCPAGCISHHQWTFHVASDGTLTLVSESGDPLPPGTVVEG
jgi:hypothetical protein